ncbi:uncharacterized protein LOC120770689 [Bactrocera tryoni]|uniref:uncharacterized protein LOC120770689 n=1 Tax=Bactrocera tryoni TaxID=59916 RepID=UPI001A96E2A5|nr:uncharacterized protein LOC120770689 [Bactrocera tryoni]
MEVVCNHCGALKFAGETPGLCCLSGKVKLPPLPLPTEPLRSLLTGETPESRHFLSNAQKYNGCFQMTSFGADIIHERGFIPTFEIQGQIHHLIGSLLPLEDAQHKFLQIYFMGNVEHQLDQRQTINTIPDPETDPDLHDVVITNMINGPCGAINPQSPCMVDGKCSKRYPQNLTVDTITGKDGYPLYRRRSSDDGGRTITVKVKGNDFVVDNSWVVPYSPLLSKTFRAHCNVEYCNSVKSIKYICKYVTKGSDRAAFGLQAPDPNDEITRYQNGRYVCSNEERQNVYSHLPFMNATTLTSFFSICQSDPFARALLYSEMPRYYTWNASSKKFQRRKQGNVVPGHPDVRSTEALGCIYTVYPKNDECFYLRLLLVNVRGPTSFESLRTVNGIVLPTFRVARHELNLHSENPHLDMNEEMHNQALVLIEDMCYLMCGSLLARLGMTSPDRGVNDAFERELQREREYDTNALSQLVRTNIPLLNPQQKELYDTVMKAIDDGNIGMIFLDAPDGT